MKQVEVFIRKGGNLPTLGKRSIFTFGTDRQGMFVRTAAGNRVPMNAEQIAVTLTRHAELRSKGVNERGTKKHLATGQYSRPSWEECPNDRVCPYIAAIVAHLENES